MEIKKTHKLQKRIIYTIFMLAIFMLGKCIPLYGVRGLETGAEAQSMVTLMLSGDRYQTTMMALGIMPYINASLLVQVVSAFRSAKERAKISKQKSERWMLIATVVIATIMSVVQSGDLTYKDDVKYMALAHLVVIIEMLGGAMLMYVLCRFNEKRGVGAAMPFILVNIITSLAGKLSVNHFLSYTSLIYICVAVICITLIMENVLIKLPLQRVSIHNIYADKNYMAYKLNPVGIVPVMFATAAFIAPSYLFRLLAALFPDNSTITYINKNMVMDKPIGIGVYLAIIVMLAIIFSFIMLTPGESARQLQINGDSIVGIYAGKKTVRYLVTLVLKLSLLSGILQAACMSIPLILSYRESIPAELALIPTSAMILVSIICSFIQEIGSYRRYDAYRFFF